MHLHEDKKLFADAVLAAANHLGIKPLFVEKDYWITRSLKLMKGADATNRAIFKGGTSLSKAHRIGARFSEDIDVAIVDANSLSGNQRKSLIKRLAKAMTTGLTEIDTPGVTSKGSSYYRAIYGYESLPELSKVNMEVPDAVLKGQLMVEINTFANPYPFVECEIDNFIAKFLRETDNRSYIAEYGLDLFQLNVLDKRRTATEKLVSLFRFSLSADAAGSLSRKIRHFYDLYFLMNDVEVRDYILSDTFTDDFTSLLNHDRMMFFNPDNWNERPLDESPLFGNMENLWRNPLSRIYSNELSSLAYRRIPLQDEVLHNIIFLMNRIKSIGIT